MRPGSAIPDRNHELLRMPEREDDVASALIEGINCFMTTRLTTHGRRDAPNQRSTDWRQQRKLRPTFEPALEPGLYLHLFSHDCHTCRATFSIG